MPEKLSSHKPVMPGSAGAASQPVAPRLARNSVSAGIREISREVLGDEPFRELDEAEVLHRVHTAEAA